MNSSPVQAIGLQMFRQHWGDLPIIPDTESGIAALEREQITKPRALEIEGAKLHQLSKPEKTVIAKDRLLCVDPLTLHTIQLLEHIRKLQGLLQIEQEQNSESLPKDVGSMLLCPAQALPLRPEMPSGAITGRQPGDITNKDGDSDFLSGKGECPPELTCQLVHLLLRKTVAIICAHAGFDTSSEIVLDTLTSVVHEYMMKMCSLLRVAVDREALTGRTGFVDAVEEVFHHLGLGSVTSLHQFYQVRVVGYHHHLQNLCQSLEAEYLKISTPQVQKPTQEIRTVKIPSDEPGIGEIQFPLSEEMDTSGPCPSAVPAPSQEQSPPPLEELHGALQGMEGSTSLKEEPMKWLPPLRNKDGPDTTQNLDSDEIINVSDTPEPASGSDMEQMPPSVTCDPLTLSPASDTMAQICKPPKKKKKK